MWLQCCKAPQAVQIFAIFWSRFKGSPRIGAMPNDHLSLNSVPREPDFFKHCCLVNALNGEAMARATLTRDASECREKAVQTVLAQGLSLQEAGQRLVGPKGTRDHWVAAAKLGEPAVAAPGSRSVATLEAEVAKLCRDIAQASV
jgi:hypothetical protein